MKLNRDLLLVALQKLTEARDVDFNVLCVQVGLFNDFIVLCFDLLASFAHAKRVNSDTQLNKVPAQFRSVFSRWESLLQLLQLRLFEDEPRIYGMGLQCCHAVLQLELASAYVREDPEQVLVNKVEEHPIQANDALF
eukprot:CAMPEP_0170630890 /NCGR_PEP_ID=MMETSP0224-20130122/34284_1 /TAXON_ID=285029 /ORGANISM="Togula jolla, Strain CCCM 725" /LENGTH=136 /DNA_ID=CAMNT_0010959063 /DNA_START=793 /DNA_END=1203 /DNA_ORIENTATION=-